jgi:Type I phosphodiesterase / nucleotide pyrophosphatase
VKCFCSADRRPSCLGALALLLAAGIAAVAGAEPGSAGASPGTVILISLDGTRPADVRPEWLPSLVELGRRGVRAEALIPVNPTVTFPSHVSLVTGVDPDVHGVVNNNFDDPVLGGFDSDAIHTFIESEPIWSIAERRGIPTASYYWVGSEGPWARGPGPRETRRFSSRTREKTKVDQILRWLALADPAARPRLITCWFHGGDRAGHEDGPGAPSVGESLVPQDREIARLVAELERRGAFATTTLIFVSDHGMAAVKERVNLGTLLRRHGIRAKNFGVGGFSIVVAGPTRRRPRDLDRIVAVVRGAGLEAFRREEAPADWHVANPRFGDVVVRAPIGTAIVTPTSLIEGFHGHASEAPEMAAFLVAYGRGVRNGAKLGRVSSLAVAPTVLRLLDLPVPEQMKTAPIAELTDLPAQAPGEGAAAPPVVPAGDRK